MIQCYFFLSNISFIGFHFTINFNFLLMRAIINEGKGSSQLKTGLKMKCLDGELYAQNTLVFQMSR